MSRFVYYKKSKIHYTIDGNGITVVLLHGFLENLTMWDTLKPHLLKTHCVICIDLPGHGKSECVDDIHTMDIIANTVNLVLEHEKLNEVILIGHSMGGYACLAFANQFPKKVKAICLANSTFKEDSPDKKANRERALIAVEHNYKSFVRITIPSLFKESNLHKHQNQIERLVSDALKLDPKGIIASIKGMMLRSDSSDLFLKSTFKKMLIIGENDPIINVEELIKLTKPNDVEIVILKGGHMSYIENIEDFTYNIMHFIENI